MLGFKTGPSAHIQPQPRCHLPAAELEICKRPDGSDWELGSGGFGKVCGCGVAGRLWPVGTVLGVMVPTLVGCGLSAKFVGWACNCNMLPGMTSASHATRAAPPLDPGRT